MDPGAGGVPADFLAPRSEQVAYQVIGGDVAKGSADYRRDERLLDGLRQAFAP